MIDQLINSLTDKLKLNPEYVDRNRFNNSVRFYFKTEMIEIKHTDLILNNIGKLVKYL